MTTTATTRDLLETVTGVVEFVEERIPEAGRGSEKLAIAKNILEIVLQNAVVLWPMISALIAVLVQTFNTIGKFKTSTNNAA